MQAMARGRWYSLRYAAVAEKLTEGRLALAKIDKRKRAARDLVVITISGWLLLRRASGGTYAGGLSGKLGTSMTAPAVEASGADFGHFG
jgi:hypothetical protein